MTIDPNEEFRRLECDDHHEEVTVTMLVAGAVTLCLIIGALAWVVYG